MRIIAGTAGRVAIKVPRDITRPTTDFVRQALFSMLGETVIGAKVLDLFAGSGALGLEALSRGAASCVFVDENRLACATIAENLEKTRLSGGRVVKSAVMPFLKRETTEYDLIFADPPYWKHAPDIDHLSLLLAGAELARCMAEGAWFIAEAPAGRTLPHSDTLEVFDHRKYGSCGVWLYRAKIQGEVTAKMIS
jgi:16S rRNA (guanine966-N2)-methyltransferase